ncbi:mitochondrial uncoupling protein 3 [Tanacetum coccineum]
MSENQQKTNNPTNKILISSLSSTVAETFTFPIDITKTRLQLTSSTTHPNPTSAFHVATNIIRKEGVTGLYKGLSPAVIRHVFYTPIRTVGYEYLRHAYVTQLGRKDGYVSLPVKAVIGGISGVIAQYASQDNDLTLIVDQCECDVEVKGSILTPYKAGGPFLPLVEPEVASLPLVGVGLSTSQPPPYTVEDGIGTHNPWKTVVASPADLVKVRMQADGRLVSQGLQPRYTGPLDALHKIIHTEGFKGLWKGVVPNVQRAFLVNMGELACYDHAKHFVINNHIANDNIFAHTLASMMSGLSATTISCPADVVKTRMMNQAVNENGKFKYNNSYDCLVKTVRYEGVRALWKGFFPTWARLGGALVLGRADQEQLRFCARVESDLTED